MSSLSRTLQGRMSNRSPYSMVLRRFEMAADIADFNPVWIVSYPQVDPVGLTHHRVEAVRCEITLWILKHALIAEPLHG